MHCSLSQHSVWVVDCDCALPRPVFLGEGGGRNFKWLDGDGTRVRIFISISISPFLPLSHLSLICCTVLSFILLFFIDFII